MFLICDHLAHEKYREHLNRSNHALDFPLSTWSSWSLTICRCMYDLHCLRLPSFRQCRGWWRTIISNHIKLNLTLGHRTWYNGCTPTKLCQVYRIRTSLMALCSTDVFFFYMMLNRCHFTCYLAVLHHHVQKTVELPRIRHIYIQVYIGIYTHFRLHLMRAMPHCKNIPRTALWMKTLIHHPVSNETTGTVNIVGYNR